MALNKNQCVWVKPMFNSDINVADYMWLFASIFLLLINQTGGKFCKYPHKHREQHLINAYGVPVEGCFYLVVHSSVCIYDAFGQGYGFGHTVWSDKMWAEVVLRNSSWSLSNNSFQHLCKFFSYRSEILKMDGPPAGHPSRWHLWRWGRDPTAPPHPFLPQDRG